MKNKTYIFLLFLWAILLAPPIVAQEDAAGEWMRVRGNAGEFSIEFPAAYELISDDAGFSVSNRHAQDFLLKDVRILNAFYEKTLLGFEVYKTDSAKSVADALADHEENSGKRERIKVADAKVKQIVTEKKEFYAVRRFYAVRDYVYVLTAASRNGETVAMKRFLDSFRLKTDKMPIEPAAQTENVKTVSFADLKVLQLQIDQNPASSQKPADKNATAPAMTEKDENSLPFVAVVKPKPSYTNAARQDSETGVVRLRLTFTPNGSVKKIDLLTVLDSGLLRQSVFAALRLKFLPPEKNGKAVGVIKTLEYGFNIY